MLVGTGEWVYSIEYRQTCQIIDVQSLWDEVIYRVWLPIQDTIVRIPASRLKPLDEAVSNTPAHLTYTATAARLADALTHDILLAPIESRVIPLPHQMRALSQAINSHRVRYLLADEVGLGKTIEAGLIMRELKLRGRVKRTLVIAPKGLLTQWVAEMQVHFNEDFKLLIPGDFSAYRKIMAESNIWQSYDQVVCPMDSIKPLEGRRGWSKEQVAAYNQERFEDIIAAGWDLVIVDEAHRLSGSSEEVARYKLGQGLADASPYLLLLSATPHQGKTDAFYRLISLLDTLNFPGIESITKERVKPYVIRTEKRSAIDANGKPLFKPRQTRLIPISWEQRHKEQQLLYEAVTEYARKGYNQAIIEKKNYIGFLMILMQRLITSSTRAIRTTLERRLEILQGSDEQLTLPLTLSEDEWLELDGQEQINAFLATRLVALKNEREEVRLLLNAAKRTESSGPDPKAEALLDWIYKIQQEEGNPELKFLVFTEFVPTQEMLREFFKERGFSVVCLNGSMGMDERKVAQDNFSQKARILISTDAGGEGLNLQFCHVVINYDIPWNPMRLEQRIGRVDRIGQTHPVKAINFVLKGTVEHRVQEVLEEKLAIILKEFGVDKAGDVLDSLQAEQIFDDLYINAIIHPETFDDKIELVVTNVKEQVKSVRESTSILGSQEELNPLEARRLSEHPLPHWIETMTINYLKSHGGVAERKGKTWNLTWPSGEKMNNIVFTLDNAEGFPSARQLTLEDSCIRGVSMNIPPFVSPQPIPCLIFSDISTEIQGFWSLWKVAIQTSNWNRQRIMPLFLHDDGRILYPTARYIWDKMISNVYNVRHYLDGQESQDIFNKLWKTAEKQGRSQYEQLVQEHKEFLTQEINKWEYALTVRRKTIERLGLPQVRAYRLLHLEQEDRERREEINQKSKISPELVPLLLIRVGEKIDG
ncbi:MAG: helicase [Candidatus Jettenia sp.]|nr:MAG: helicase [Candidatus Jettenia sp. AMX1]MBC6930072.1 helicase [Candidatus Jettenia sp.]MCE7881532.1 helicase [Candidatus Jettenia sp. AMX1]MCQ3928149.1 helicase [Candidatus Jettenia sp.]MDL1939970.1 helicase [Candidatus Jettenia sp. AMX1]